jgi:hypothetical protein
MIRGAFRAAVIVIGLLVFIFVVSRVAHRPTQTSAPAPASQQAVAVAVGSVHVNDLYAMVIEKTRNPLDRTPWQGSVTGAFVRVEGGKDQVHLVLTDLRSRRWRVAARFTPTDEQMKQLATLRSGDRVTLVGKSNSVDVDDAGAAYLHLESFTIEKTP